MADQPEEAVRLAARALLEPVLMLMEEDSHQFGTRPCQTCRAISIVVGRKFGCERKQRAGDGAPHE